MQHTYSPRAANRTLRFEQLEARCVLSTAVPGLPELTVHPPPDQVPSEQDDLPCGRMMPYVREETLLDAGDYYRYNDGKIPLLRVQNEIVVGLRDGVDPAAVAEQLTNENGPLAGWTRFFRMGPYLGFRWVPQEAEVGRAFGIAEQRLEDVPEVSWTGPVFVPPTHRLRLVVTDELVVSGVEALERVGEEIISARPFIAGGYVAKIAGGGGLYALELAHRIGAHPDFLVEIEFFPTCNWLREFPLHMPISPPPLPLSPPHVPGSTPDSPPVIYELGEPVPTDVAPLPTDEEEVDGPSSPVGSELDSLANVTTGEASNTSAEDDPLGDQLIRTLADHSELDLLFGEPFDSFDLLSLLSEGP